MVVLVVGFVGVADADSVITVIVGVEGLLRKAQIVVSLSGSSYLEILGWDCSKEGMSERQTEWRLGMVGVRSGWRRSGLRRSGE